MPITRHYSGRWLFQFDRIIPGAGRVRSNKLLPQGWTKAKAQEWDQREAARLWDVATGGRPAENLIADAVLLYLKHRCPQLKNKRDIEAALSYLLPWYEGKPLSELPNVARQYLKDADVAPATIRNRLAYLRSACRWAWKHHSMGEHDPAERMVLPPVRNARQIYLGRAEMLRIARAMNYGWARDVVRLAFYTGMRAGEILRCEVTPEGLSVADTKNGNPRIVPIHDRIAHLTRGPWPPAITVWTASKAFKAAARGVGLGHARLHDLRHSAASEMVNAGIDLFVIGGVLGHKSAVSTARYAHLATAKLKEAVGKIGRNSPTSGTKKAA